VPVVNDGADYLIEHPVPEIDTGRAETTARRAFGIDGHASPLESERDRNFLIESDQGAFALKFANPAEGADVLALQAAALEHLARVDPDLPVPRNRTTVDGDLVGSTSIDGIDLPLRMVTFLPGSVVEQGESSEPLRRSISTTLARMGLALRGFFHPAAGRRLLWDLTHLLSLRSKLHYVPAAQLPVIEKWFDKFEREVAPRLPHLRAQIIHNDFNPDNMLIDPEHPDHVSGIIDFGDMVHAPLIIDLAVAAGYQILGRDDPVAIIAEMAAAYHAVVPLEPEEVDVLPILAISRLAQSLVIGEWRARLHPDNTEYILNYHPPIWDTLQRLNELDLAADRGAVREACGMPAVPPAHSADLAPLLARRRLRLGSGMRLSYSQPLHLVAGQGVWLIDSEGRRYLDAYNNVPHVGHSHPQVTAAISRQTATLNTNTRYLVEQVVDYADRLAALFPGDLNVVMFTNSGSEANDLAWRMAQTVTGHRGMIVTRHAYHGSTALTMATSPEEIGHGTLEPWVATVPAPDCRLALDGSIEQAVRHLGDRGHQPAAVAFDTVFSSDGIFEPPDGYFRSAAELVRESGGLFIADEVQAGFGRVGPRLWGFADHDFVPDIVTLGKPMGNGHPIAAVVTTPAIAEEFTRLGYFFSTFAGNPVSTAAAMAVLDVMEAEELPARAERVGSYLRTGLRRLAADHPAISEIRGPGLFTGVEMSAGNEPDPERARLVVNELRLRRILIGRTGLHGNVLKIRPPLAFDESHADMLTGALGEVLDLTQE
jgi:4-aminobutyrate aminotransferase-like enzyme/Ser/Thr protein kinase RdoA (MazF antagonist)